MASRASARTAMKACSAPIAHAAIATPSTTAAGSRSSSVLSVVDAGSAPYPFATTYRGVGRPGSTSCAAAAHLSAAR